MRKDSMVSAPSRQGRRMGGGIRWQGRAALLGAASLLVSCSAELYHKRADREAYSALFEKTTKVDNVSTGDVELTEPAELDLSSLRTKSTADEIMGKFADYEKGAKIMPLDVALETGIQRSRAYRSAKESLYLKALDLTLARHRLSPIFFTGGRGTRATDSRSAALEAGMTELVSTNTFARTQSAGFNWLYSTGARLSADFTQDFLRIMSGNRSINESDVAVSLVQPLLKGGGVTVTLEALTQEERNLLYALRDFADYRRDFIVSLTSDYYGVLRARDQVRNSYVAYQGFVKNVEREEGFADVGRRTQNQLGRLRQAKLTAETRWIDAIRSYITRLDEFKITLGLPVDMKIILDDGELDKLRIEDPAISRDQSVEIALVSRPDLANVYDQVADAERRIKVAKNGLLPGLDVSLDYNAVSDPGDTTPGINWDRRRWSSSVDLDLPLDRKAERNIYRAAFVNLDRARRAEELARDRARFEVYEGWRALEQEKQGYRLADDGVALAQRRLEEQLLLSELGQGEALDLIDAQEDLVNAQNLRTGALVDYTLARMRLWRDMGILYIKPDGSWAEKLKNESPR